MLAVQVAENNGTFGDTRAVRYLALAAEPRDLCPSPFGETYASFIVGVQHGEIAGPLVFEDPGLGIGVGLKCTMPVKMVRGHVEYDGNFRTEGLDRFQLKAGDLQH